MSKTCPLLISHWPKLPIPRLVTTQGEVGSQCPETCPCRKRGKAPSGGRTPPHSGTDLPGLPRKPSQCFHSCGLEAAPHASCTQLACDPAAAHTQALPRGPARSGGASASKPGLEPTRRARAPGRQGGLPRALLTHLVNAAIKWFSHGFLGLLLTPQAAATALLTANGFSWQCSISNINNQRLIKTKRGKIRAAKADCFAPFPFITLAGGHKKCQQ